MTRPKVDPSKRQRTAQACGSCKRRKQKCDGRVPCNTCIRRHLSCAYDIIRASQQDAQDLDGSTSEATYVPSSGYVSPSSHSLATSPTRPESPNPTFDLGSSPKLQYTGENNHQSRAPLMTQAALNQTANVEMSLEAGSSLADDGDTENYTTVRMLEDETGRLVYYGDAANCSFLQLLRMLVETTVGHSPFTLDPDRHRLLADEMDDSIQEGLSFRLLDEASARILVESFIVHTTGIFDVLDEQVLRKRFDECYAGNLRLDRVSLSQVFFVLAIGLTLARPEPGTPEARVIEHMRKMSPDQAQILYYTAKALHNPIATLEMANLYSVQSLACMALFMAVRSMRDTAFSYLGMAIQAAYKLGLHCEKTLALFALEERQTRIRLWRSLFAFDRLLGAALGRPMFISDDEAKAQGHLSPRPRVPESLDGGSSDGRSSPASSFEATVRSCRIMGRVLSQTYEQRMISAKTAQLLAEECINWPKLIPPSLHWPQASSSDVKRANGIFHANMTYYQAVMLLTRPFFLHNVSDEIQRHSSQSSLKRLRTRHSPKAVNFSHACIVVSNQIIALVSTAHRGGYLSPFNILAACQLFSAALILLTQKLAWPLEGGFSEQFIVESISIMTELGASKPEARRNAQILRDYKDVVDGHVRKCAATHSSLQARPSWPIGPAAPDKTYDPTYPSAALRPGPPPAFSRSIPPHPMNPPTGGTPYPSMNHELGTTIAPSLLGQDGDLSDLLRLDNDMLSPMSEHMLVLEEEMVDFDALWPMPVDPWATSGVPSSVSGGGGIRSA